MSSENGWSEYKKLFESDREENAKRFETIDEKLTEISESLVRIETQRDSAKWLSGFVIPAIVGGVVAAIAAFFR